MAGPVPAGPSLADVMAGSPTSMTAPTAEALPGEAPDAEGADEEAQEKQDYAWEFHNAQTPEDAATALEAFVRLIR